MPIGYTYLVKKVLTLRYTGQRLPAFEATQHAEGIHEHFGYSPNSAETYGRLSIAVRELGKYAALHTVLSGRTLDLLISARCLDFGSPSEGGIEVTEKGLVAANLVQAEEHEGDIEMWLEEPFREIEILAKLHRTAHPKAISSQAEMSFSEPLY